MSSTEAMSTTLLGTTWIANAEKHDVNKITIQFNSASTCTTMVGAQIGPVCSWTEYWANNTHYFGLTGGSIHFSGSCSVAAGTGQATGVAAGAGPEGWTLTKQ